MSTDAWLESIPLLQPVIDEPWLRPLLVLLAFLTAALVVEVVGGRLLRRWLAGRSQVGVVLLDHLLRTSTILLVLAGLHYASLYIGFPDRVRSVLASCLGTLAVLPSAWSLHAAIIAAMEHAVTQNEHARWLQPHTLPLLDMALTIVLGLFALNLVFLTWHIDLTAWVASAGIVSVAVGLAAQETLSNLLSGAMLLTDQSIRVGDFLVLEDGTRGRVLDIGLRSTRLVTSDQVEVIVPNKQMAGSRVLNVSTGPLPYERFHVAVQVAYATDLDHARAVLLEVGRQLKHAIQDVPEAEPLVRMVSFDDSGITLWLCAFGRPEDREVLRDEMIHGIHRAFRAADIQIPFPQLDAAVMVQIDRSTARRIAEDG